jgi:hypothetical protein
MLCRHNFLCGDLLAENFDTSLNIGELPVYRRIRESHFKFVNLERQRGIMLVKL